ncbi:FKBP-type peptidyl-prolyl cis-trans isomerase FkpA [Neolewinella xylanilytica]|uniref:Peptidyl-prolyl cis-trans isomerase n=1 Tax=Neolewinella xylanilytica TaxID=1514080 RepID=A0A2S6IBM5_9BACT|nr:FKBP-type peptidyl-prolyl cis-trans isomerase [Neolewinella xylanilytica]PPK88911.1 FKBP-type peptidyl-prolyl cis-trans isomerase FkpA [Neolewinella xylanilytica]
MFNLRFLLILPVLVFVTSCGSDDDIELPPCESETISIEAFAAADTIMYSELDTTGLLYFIVDSGTVERPTETSTVVANYRGIFTDGQIFDQTNTTAGPATFALSNVIEGWQLGVPLIGEGGEIRLLIPSELAYGSQPRYDQFQRCVIPANSDLVFDIRLEEIR